MYSILSGAAGLRLNRATVLKDYKETALESLRRYNIYSQLMEAFQFVNCHPKMATLIIGVGICLHLPSVLYFSIYYIKFLTGVYCTMIPNLIALFNFNAERKFAPPRFIFLLCALNLITCYLGLVCVVLCIYLLLPIKGKYLKTVQTQLERRRRICVILSVILAMGILYQIIISLYRSIQFHLEHLEPNHATLLSESQLSNRIEAQGIQSFWTLHAFTDIPCCFSHPANTSVLSLDLPSECCQAFLLAPKRHAACRRALSRDLLWPHCVGVALNIVGDIEVTMDAQMQAFLLIFCVVTFVIKYALSPHMLMLCVPCRPTYGWIGMRRSDN